MSIPKFGVTRPVPVNLLMGSLIIAGVVSGLSLTREFFPETAAKSATISLPYPGATPEEIEASLARKVEDKIFDLEEVERLQTTIVEGSGRITVEFRDGVDVKEATDEVERSVESLIDLPEESERIQVAEFEPRLPTIMLTVYGDADEEALKRTIRAIRDDLNALPGMGEIIISGVRDYEIRIDVEAAALLEQGLSLPQVSDAVQSWMLDTPGGTVRTSVGNINVRTMGVEERAAAIRDIVVRASSDGQVLRIRDIATVRDDYVDEQILTRFRTGGDGGPSVSLTVYKIGDQDAVKIAKMVRAYVRGRRAAAGLPDGDFEPRWNDRLFAILNATGPPGEAPRLQTPRQKAYRLGLEAAVPLPSGTFIGTSSDLARFIEGRLDLLLRNARAGAILVVLTLLVFLNWRTAWWVTVGLFTALCGTLLFMYVVGVTLNLLTMFGLIVVIGLLVDDAIVVAENVQARHDRAEPALVAAVKGTEQVFWPVVATILTSIVAFLPLTFVRGQIGDLLGALPYVVACALMMSLVESLLILPSHMGHSLIKRDRRKTAGTTGRLGRFEAWRDRLVMERIVPAFGRLLDRVLEYRYISVAVALAVLIVSAGMVAGGRIQFTFLPVSDSETIIVDLKMPIGTSIERTEAIVRRLEVASANQPETKSVSTMIGVQAAVDDTSGVTSAGRGTHLGQLFVELHAVEAREARGERESSEVIAAIREDFGDVVGIESLSFLEIQGGPGGKDITVEIAGRDEGQVAAIVDEAKRRLAELDGVYDIADNNAAGQREVRIDLKPGAAALGFSVADVARQVRGALFGLDAHVFSAREEDIDVRVRLDETSRRSLSAIENLWIISPTGRRVPMSEIATVTESTSYNTIRRVDRRRAVSVTADVAPGVSPETITAELAPGLKALQRANPGITVELAGRQRELRKAFQSLPIGFATAMILIYVILAWLFGSYVQPFAVMLGIPFALIGVVWGHYLLNFDMTFLSLIGFVALSGIVVNDSLIFVQFFNELCAKGQPMREALVEAGRQRLRPIFLTTITTVLGLTPLMLERSFQAKFLIPMAIAIAFGLMSATLLILLVLPCILLIIDDLRALLHFLWFGRPRDTEKKPGAIGIEDFV